MGSRRLFLVVVVCICLLVGSFAPADAFTGTAVDRPSLRPPPGQKRLATSAIVNLGRISSSALHRIPRGGGGATAPASTSTSSSSALPMVAPEAASVVFDSAPFVQSLSIYAAANGLGTLLSLFTKSQLHVDLLGTGAFALAALPSLMVKGGGGAATLLRVKVSSAAVSIWGTKLAAFLLYRIVKTKHDARVTQIFGSVSGTLGFWTFSFLWGVICSLPHALGTTSSSPGNPISLAVGTAIYAVGLAVETLADYQKWTFKASNPGKFCNVGLWSISQHPNFLGNMLIWSGVLVMNAPALIEPLDQAAGAAGTDLVGGGLWSVLWSQRRLLLALLGPAFMWYLFSSQANGDLTNAVELAQERYGDDPEFVRYVKDVPKIIPNLFFRGE